MDGSNKKTKGFFKFFNPESSSQKMKFPPDVTTYMGGKLPRTVFLRDRYKNMWKVNVGKSGNDLFFEEGWDKFIKDNSLEYGDFLVFDYIDTKSLFEFKLLGSPCCCEKIGVGGPNFLVKEEVEWEQIDSLEDEEEEEEWDQSDSLEDENEEEEEEWDQRNDNIINENNMSEDEDEYEHKEVKEEEEEEDDHGEHRKTAPRRNFPKQKAFDYTGASIFKSGLYPQPINPYFVAKTRKGRKNELHIPEYVIHDFNIKLPPKMILRDPRGIDWEAKVKTWKDGRLVLAGGWNQLCKWNLIQEEDSCICEFVSEERGMGTKELILQIQVVQGPRA